MKHEIPSDLTAELYDKALAQFIRKPLYRDVLHDKYVDGMTFEEIAEKYDRSVRGIAYICHREGDKVLELLSQL